MVKEKYYLCKDLSFKVILSKEKSLDKPKFNLPMEITMKGNGKTIKPMDLEFTNTILEPFMKVTGVKICRMELEYKLGRITVNTKGLI